MWTGEKELTPGQLAAARTAGLWADRPGLGAEYPKAVYRRAVASQDHKVLGEPIKVQGKYEVETATVHSADEELQALEQGWALTPADADPAVTIEPKRGPGRPPKVDADTL